MEKPQGLKPPSGTLVFCIFLVYAFLHEWFLGTFPFERVGGWDHLWSESRLIGGIAVLKEALQNGEWPLLDLYNYFGWHLGGDIFSIWALPNLMTAFLDPISFYIFRSFLMIAIAGFGTYLFFCRLGVSAPLAFLAGVFYVIHPLGIGIYHGESFNFLFFLFPVLLVTIWEVVQAKSKWRWLQFLLVSFLIAGLGDFNALPTYPAVVFASVFLLSQLGTNRGVLRSLALSSVSVAGFLLAGAYYYGPFVYNLLSIRESIDELKDAGIVAQDLRLPVTPFSKIFENSLSSLWFPVEGGGIMLYSNPLFYAISIFTAAAGALGWKSLERAQKILFAFLYSLIASPLLMYLEPAILYSDFLMEHFPGIAVSSRGSMRYQLNLIPYANLLSGFLSIYLLSKTFPNRFKWIALSFGIFGLILNVLLLIQFDKSFPDRLHPSTNIFSFGKTISLVLLGVIQASLVGVGWFFMEVLKKKHALQGALASIPIALIYLLCLNEVYYGHNRTYLTDHPFRWDNHVARMNCMKNYFDSEELLNHRVLFAVPEQGPNGRLTSWHFNIDFELGAYHGYRPIFNYREMAMPYSGLLLGTFGGQIVAFSNHRTASQKLIPQNIDMMNLMSTKFVVSAYNKIDSPRLELLGECEMPPTPAGIQIRRGFQEQGRLYYYRLEEARSILWLGSDFVKKPLSESLQNIFHKRVFPWNQGQIEVPHSIDGSNSERPQNDDQLTVSWKSQSVSGRVAITESRPLVFNMHYRPNWRARVDGEPVSVMRAYGGMMAISLPPGEHEFEFFYRPWEFYLGLALTGLAFLLGAVSLRKSEF